MSGQLEKDANLKNTRAMLEQGVGVLSKCHEGDRWMMRCILGETDYSMTIELLGEDGASGKDTYVMRVSFGPGAAGRPDSMMVHVDCATLFPVRVQSL